VPVGPSPGRLHCSRVPIWLMGPFPGGFSCTCVPPTMHALVFSSSALSIVCFVCICGLWFDETHMCVRSRVKVHTGTALKCYISDMSGPPYLAFCTIPVKTSSRLPLSTIPLQCCYLPRSAIINGTPVNGFHLRMCPNLILEHTTP
jgi:hypothetical protein